MEKLKKEVLDTNNPMFGVLDENKLTFKFSAQYVNLWEYLFLIYQVQVNKTLTDRFYCMTAY